MVVFTCSISHVRLRRSPPEAPEPPSARAALRSVIMVECRDVEKRFATPARPTGGCWRLEELVIAPQERVLVTGPSGCGKTTLLNLVSGLLRPDSGTVTVDGVRVDQLSTSQADVFRGQRVGLIFQSFQLLTPLSVTENLLLGARYGRKWYGAEALRKAEVLLGQVGLGDRRHHRPGELSLGEQQRVAIARALINDPALLLADEPTASLDRRNADAVLELLFGLCAGNGTTLVAVSHDARVAERFDRVVDAGGWMGAVEEAAGGV